jgi:DNA-directed RNA polymerase subunit RPC12/RpoP
MFIARFECSKCRASNKQEVILKEKETPLSCSYCGSTIMTIEGAKGCWVVISNELGLVDFVYSEIDHKSYIKQINQYLKRKPKFRVEAVFVSKQNMEESGKINKNIKLNKYRALTKGTYYKIPIPEAISIISMILKRKPEWVFNQEYKNPMLPTL